MTNNPKNQTKTMSYAQYMNQDPSEGGEYKAKMKIQRVDVLIGKSLTSNNITSAHLPN